jgi:hypothetical protein
MPLDDHRIYGHEPSARLVLLRHSFNRVRFWLTSLHHNSVSGGMRKTHPILNRANWVFDLNRYAAISGGDNACKVNGISQVVLLLQIPSFCQAWMGQIWRINGHTCMSLHQYRQKWDTGMTRHAYLTMSPASVPVLLTPAMQLPDLF